MLGIGSQVVGLHFIGAGPALAGVGNVLKGKGVVRFAGRVVLKFLQAAVEAADGRGPGLDGKAPGCGPAPPGQGVGAAQGFGGGSGCGQSGQLTQRLLEHQGNVGRMEFRHVEAASPRQLAHS